jgi:hypothetical protein
MWLDREKDKAQYAATAQTQSDVDRNDNADIALTLSKQLIAVVKVKNFFHVEAGLEMIALAMSISSEVSGVYIVDNLYFLSIFLE